MKNAKGWLSLLLLVTITHGNVIKTINSETNRHEKIKEIILEHIQEKQSANIDTRGYNGLKQQDMQSVLRNLINEEETEIKEERTITNKLQLLDRTLKKQEERNEKEQRNNNQKKKAKGKFKGTGFVFDNIKKIEPDSWCDHILNSFTISVDGSLHQIFKQQNSKDVEDEVVVDNRNMNDKDVIERNLKTMETSPNRYWPNGIVPYTIDTGFDETQKAKIETAVTVFNSVSCVQWVPRDDQPDYVTFRSGGGGCGSGVGRSGGEQILTAGGANCGSTKLINHEMFHAIGGYHEMSRPDADDYITIHWENIQDGRKPNFVIKSGIDTYYPYDVSSILHYPLNAFSKNKQRTIDLKDWRLNFLVNTGTGLMYYDVAEINHYYQCEESCTEKLLCDNGGYQTEDCTCHCPDPLEGELCQTPVTDETCGGVITITGEDEIEITSPNYPSNYDAGAVCTWLIQGVKDNVVRVTVQDMDISHNYQACYHWLEFRYNLLGQEGPKRCGTTSYEVWDASTDELPDKMILQFDSFTGSDKATSRGFKLSVRSIGTGCQGNPCLHGSCFSPLDTDSYTCTCYPGFTGDNCTELSIYAAVGCTVEVGEICILSQEKNTDDFDWVTQTGEAPYYRRDSLNLTDVTGPGGAIQGFVYFMLANNNPGMNATLFTEVDFPKVERCLSFWYHMRSLYVNSMGTLNVYMESASTPQTLLFTRSYNQGKSWLYTQIDIPAVDGLKISFEGIRGTDWMSDMAIDDVKLTPGTCDNPLTMPASTTTTTSVSSTTTTTTPPSTPAPTTTTTTPSTPAPTTTTTTTPPSTPAPTTTTTTTTQAPTTTTQPPTSTPTTTTTPPPTPPLSTSTTVTTTTGQSRTGEEISFCGFEKNNNVRGEPCVFDTVSYGLTTGHWIRRKQKHWGPQAYEGNYYMSMHSNGQTSESHAVMSTINYYLNQESGPSSHCLEFYYYINANYEDAGGLYVWEVDADSTDDLTLMWEMTGDQGQTWHKAEVQISNMLDPVIIIEGEQKDNEVINVDNIKLTTGACP